MKILYFISFFFYSFSYDRNGAVNYAYQYAQTPNHQCGINHEECTPCAYYGNEACGYAMHGGDSANFVSQCLVKGGGHPPLNDGGPCRGYPCGFEEVGCENLANCLIQKGWKSTCGYLQPPPSYIEAGDVLNYYSDRCGVYGAPFSVFITVGGNNPKITSHSSIRVDVSYYQLDNNKPYYQWLHYNDCSDGTFIFSNGICVSACPSGTFEFSLNRTCLTNCPLYYIVNNNKCIIKPFDINTTLDEFKDQIGRDINLYINSSKLINGSNFLSIISTSDKINPEEQLNNGISSFYFGNCTNVIKEYYHIPEGQNLIIVNIELKNGKIQQYQSNSKEEESFYLGKDTEIEIFDFSGKKLDVSVCKEDLKIMKYIGNVEELDIESSKKFSNLGINVFNPSDKFFNDLCHPYDNPDNKDITLIDRRIDFYQNVTFCQDGCTFTGINYTLQIANCLCNTSYLQGENNVIYDKKESEKVNFKSITKSFVENLFSFNIEVVKCYNLVIDPKILIQNYGFYSLFIMLLLQVVFHIIYLVKKLKSLKYFMLKFNGRNIINKKVSIFNKNNNKNNIKLNKNNYKNKFKVNFPPKNIKVKNQNIGKSPGTKIYFKYNVYNYKNNNDINLKDNAKNQENNNIKKINNSEEYSKDMLKGKLSKNLNKINISNIKFKSKFRNIRGKKKISLKNKNNLIQKKINKEAIIKLSRTDYDLQDIDYEEAIIFDKRSYLRMFWGFLLDSQIILGTFCTENHLDLFVIKLSFLVCTFQISFFLNALFYTDEYISDAYHNEGVLDFFSGLPKSIYSFVATLITTNLLRMLSNSKSELMQIIIERNSYKNYLNLIKIKLDKLRRKLIIYFILVHILELFFLYFVTAFCAVYRNSQKYWFFGCIESFGMDSLVALIICIMLALFRFISIKKRIKYFYVLANIISIFL